METASMLQVNELIEFLPCHCRPTIHRMATVEDYDEHARVCSVYRAAHGGVTGGAVGPVGPGPCPMGHPGPMGEAGHETVNHPEHYNPGPMEAYKVIEAYDLGFHLGNVVKYVLRAGRKGDRFEDLKKARWYLEREIERMLEAARATVTPRPADRLFPTHEYCPRCGAIQGTTHQCPDRQRQSQSVEA